MTTKRNSNKYRVSVYLGKEIYEEMTQEAKMLRIPLSTYVRITLTTGRDLGKAMERGILNAYKKR